MKIKVIDKSGGIHRVLVMTANPVANMTNAWAMFNSALEEFNKVLKEVK